MKTVHFKCTDIGRDDTKMWTLGKVYSGDCPGPGTAVHITDNLGHTRTVLDGETTTFPMGTDDQQFPLTVVYRAKFVRLNTATVFESVRTVLRGKNAHIVYEGYLEPSTIRQRLADHFDSHPDGYAELTLDLRIRFAFSFAQADRQLREASI